MKIHALAALAILASPIAACGGSGDDKLAERVEDAGENQADALEDAADNLEDQAEAVRDNAEDRAEAVDDADVNADAMTETQKAAIVNGSAAPR
jgi:vacuolar-type H+-ATPase subunit H